MPGLPLKELAPFRLIVGSEDLTFLLDDGFSFSSVDPGGFEAASFSVPKDLPQTLRGTYVRLDCGLKVAFEGRVSQIQRSLGSRTQIQCEGYGAILKDDEASMVFVDRDLTKWGQPSIARQIAALAANQQENQSQVAADATSGAPSLVQSIADSWVAPFLPACEAWYDAGPQNLIARLYWDLRTSPNVGGVANWVERAIFSDDANTSNLQVDANRNSAVEVNGYFAPGVARRFVFVQHVFNNAGGGGIQGALFNAYWRLAAYGSHGLTLRGSDPGGFYPSDIAGWVIGQAPGLQPGVIGLTDVTGFILPHSVYYTPVGLDQIMGDMGIAGGWHWGVWESLSPLTGNATPRCDFRPRPQLGQFSAFCLRRDTALCDIREDLSQQFNRAVVNYTNVDGTPGAAIVTVDNPILDQAGIASRTAIIQGGTMTSATAALYGAEVLALTYAAARVAGSVQIDQVIDGPSGPTAAWLLKPGIDRLRIGDLPSFDAWGAYNDVPISRMEFAGSSSGLTTHLEVGSGANLVETLNARIASATFLAGQGG